MDPKTIQSSLDYLLTTEGKDFLINEVCKEKRQELKTNLTKVDQGKKTITKKRYVGKEGNWTDRLEDGSNAFTGGTGFGGND